MLRLVTVLILAMPLGCAASPEPAGGSRAVVDDEGRVRIGPWLLMRRSDEWVLFHRFLPPDPRKYLAHEAVGTRTTARFVVGDVHRVFLHPPRAQH